MDFENINLEEADKETLEKLTMILNLQQLDITNAKFKEEMRLMRERFEKENEVREKERLEREALREEERKRFEADLALRRERHEREMEKLRAEVDKIGNEGRKIRMEWLLAPILAGASAAGVFLMALKWWA